MAAKVATDLKRMQRLYGSPGDATIATYEAEVTEFLKAGFLGTVMYGYRRDGKWIEPMLKYTARDLAGGAANDDDPGRVRPGENIAAATFYSYMTSTAHLANAPAHDKDALEKRPPINLKAPTEPHPDDT